MNMTATTESLDLEQNVLFLLLADATIRSTFGTKLKLKPFTSSTRGCTYNGDKYFQTYVNYQLETKKNIGMVSAIATHEGVKCVEVYVDEKTMVVPVQSDQIPVTEKIHAHLLLDERVKKMLGKKLRVTELSRSSNFDASTNCGPIFASYQVEGTKRVALVTYSQADDGIVKEIKLNFGDDAIDLTLPPQQAGITTSATSSTPETSPTETPIPLIRSQKPSNEASVPLIRSQSPTETFKINSQEPTVPKVLTAAEASEPKKMTTETSLKKQKMLSTPSNPKQTRMSPIPILTEPSKKIKENTQEKHKILATTSNKIVHSPTTAPGTPVVTRRITRSAPMLLAKGPNKDLSNTEKNHEQLVTDASNRNRNVKAKAPKSTPSKCSISTPSDVDNATTSPATPTPAQLEPSKKGDSKFSAIIEKFNKTTSRPASLRGNLKPATKSARIDDEATSTTPGAFRKISNKAKDTHAAPVDEVSPIKLSMCGKVGLLIKRFDKVKGNASRTSPGGQHA